MVLQNVSKHLSCNHAVLISQNFSESGYISVKMCRGCGTGDAGSAIAPPIFLEIVEILTFSTSMFLGQRKVLQRKSHQHPQYFTSSVTPDVHGKTKGWCNHHKFSKLSKFHACKNLSYISIIFCG